MGDFGLFYDLVKRETSVYEGWKIGEIVIYILYYIISGSYVNIQ